MQECGGKSQYQWLDSSRAMTQEVVAGRRKKGSENNQNKRVLERGAVTHIIKFAYG